MVDEDPVLLGEEGLEVLPDPLRGLCLGEAEPPGEAGHVGVHGDPRHPKGRPQHHGGRLPAHPGKAHEGLILLGHLSPVLLHEPPRQGHEVLRLGAVKPDAADVGLHLLGGGLRQGLGVGKAGEEGRGGLVHAFIGGLGGEDRGHEELEGVLVPKLRAGPGVGGLEGL